MNFFVFLDLFLGIVQQIVFLFVFLVVYGYYFFLNGLLQRQLYSNYLVVYYYLLCIECYNGLQSLIGVYNDISYWLQSLLLYLGVDWGVEVGGVKTGLVVL